MQKSIYLLILTRGMQKERMEYRSINESALVSLNVSVSILFLPLQPLTSLSFPLHNLLTAIHSKDTGKFLDLMLRRMGGTISLRTLSSHNPKRRAFSSSWRKVQDFELKAWLKSSQEQALCTTQPAHPTPHLSMNKGDQSLKELQTNQVEALSYKMLQSLVGYWLL